MAKAELRTRKSTSVKPKSKSPSVRKPKKASATAEKAFMLKDKKPDPVHLTVKSRPKPPATKRRATSKAKTVAAPKTVTLVAEIKDVPPGSQAVVVWKKNRVTDNLAYWLRSTGRSMMQRLRYGRTVVPPTQAPIGQKLRTKNDLLREIATLRQENAVMRHRLGLPRAAFGRQVADAL